MPQLKQNTQILKSDAVWRACSSVCTYCRWSEPSFAVSRSAGLSCVVTYLSLKTSRLKHHPDRVFASCRVDDDHLQDLTKIMVDRPKALGNTHLSSILIMSTPVQLKVPWIISWMEGRSLAFWIAGLTGRRCEETRKGRLSRGSSLPASMANLTPAQARPTCQHPHSRLAPGRGVGGGLSKNLPNFDTASGRLGMPTPYHVGQPVTMRLFGMSCLILVFCQSFQNIKGMPAHLQGRLLKTVGTQLAPQFCQSLPTN